MGCSLCMHGTAIDSSYPCIRCRCLVMVVPWRRPIFDEVACLSKGTYPSTAMCAEFGVALPVLYSRSERTRKTVSSISRSHLFLIMDSMIELIDSALLANSSVDRAYLYSWLIVHVGC
jgi:hypothetical protein